MLWEPGQIKKAKRGKPADVQARDRARQARHRAARSVVPNDKDPNYVGGPGGQVGDLTSLRKPVRAPPPSERRIKSYLNKLKHEVLERTDALKASLTKYERLTLHKSEIERSLSMRYLKNIFEGVEGGGSHGGMGLVTGMLDKENFIYALQHFDIPGQEEATVEELEWLWRRCGKGDYNQFVELVYAKKSGTRKPRMNKFGFVASNQPTDQLTNAGKGAWGKVKPGTGWGALPRKCAVPKARGPNAAMPDDKFK